MALKGIVRSLTNTNNVGTITTTATTTAIEYGDGVNHVTVLTLTNFALGTIAGAAKAFGAKVYSFPSGVQLHEVSYFSLAIKDPTTDNACVIGIGSVIGSGGVSVLNGTPTFMDYVTEQAATAKASSPTAVAIGPVGATAGILTGISLQTAASIKDIFVNCAGTWTDTGSITCSGTLTIKWTTLK